MPSYQQVAGMGPADKGACLVLRTTLLGTALTLGLSWSAGSALADETKSIILAGGCFWCVESDFDQVPGVLETISGYTGGTLENPTYKDVTTGGTGHYEAVEIIYDPSQVSFEQLLTAFWSSVDPTDDGGQFCDRGQSYQTAVFVGDEEERALAEASKMTAEEALGQEIVTPIHDVATFYPAEGYHQNYYLNNPIRYKFYRLSCGRNHRVEEVWGDRAYEGIPKHG